MRGYSEYSHTWPGVFWFDLPLGIFLTFIFPRGGKKQLFDNLPGIIKERIYGFKDFQWTASISGAILWLIILSLLIGIGVTFTLGWINHISAGYCRA